MLPQPTRLSISELAHRIQSRLCGRVRDFRVLLQGDELVLEGVTHTFHAKQLAQHAVMEALDSPIRANNIVVY